MKSLLIVELASTKVRFLKVNSPKTTQIIARKHFKSNKNLTKDLNYTEIQKINEYVKSMLITRFPDSTKTYIYVLEDLPPLFLNRIKLSYGSNPLAYVSSFKSLGYKLRKKMAKNEINFVFYNNKIYISYFKDSRFNHKIFLDFNNFKDFQGFTGNFVEKLLLFDIDIKSSFIKILIDKDFPLKSWNYKLLYKYFKKSEISSEIVDFPAYLHF
jgi:hypothetical protein